MHSYFGCPLGALLGGVQSPGRFPRQVSADQGTARLTSMVFHLSFIFTLTSIVLCSDRITINKPKSCFPFAVG